ncbi:hypothetical protein IEQ34_003303 [Dendrobium chrysotoxum]|uniref:Uncharacterized protein n=1 Tax=Dendrobium chrysotoxum TaxID=161865 RepID=A0AAV7H2D0_DENCH|nr:hypothetical protein IEQ34_003303 [Dendrobium chrysotoxum]
MKKRNEKTAYMRCCQAPLRLESLLGSGSLKIQRRKTMDSELPDPWTPSMDETRASYWTEGVPSV